MILYLDWETRSKTPISWGTDNYVRDCEPIILTYAFDDEPVAIWTFRDGTTFPARVRKYLADGGKTELMVAHNAPFDFGVTTYGLGVQTHVGRWRCTRAQAYSHGLPGSLELLGWVLGLSDSDRKLADDKRLIQVFCVPDKSGRYVEPADALEQWAQFCAYAVRDTVALRQIHRRLPTHNYRGDGLRWAVLDSLINWRGFRFDKELARAARTLLEKGKAIHEQEISDRTDGVVRAATQRKRLLEYLGARYGSYLDDLRAATVREALDQDDLAPGLRWLLEARLEAAKSSGAKYGRGLTLAGPNDRLRWTHQVFGAGRTQRDSHKGFQPGNMARPTMESDYIEEIVIPAILDGSALYQPLLVGGVNTACANALRGSIVAAPGNELVDCDFSNVESRVLAWICRQVSLLAQYTAGADLYKLWISETFGIPVAAVTKFQRQAAKVVFLAFGFGGGVGALVTMSAGYSIDLTEFVPLALPKATASQLKKADAAWQRAILGENIDGEEPGDFGLERDVYMACDVLKQVFRETNDAINHTRYELDKAVREAIRSPGTSFEVARCTVWATNTALLIQLPDSSRLTYFGARLETESHTDSITGKVSEREYTSYMTARGMQWRRERAWAGLYIENVVQAIANRLLRSAALRIHADSLTVPEIKAYLARLAAHARTALVLRVHDSLTVDVPVGTYPLDRMIRQMNILEPCYEGLPIATDGWNGYRNG